MGLGALTAIQLAASHNQAKVATVSQPGVTETGDLIPPMFNLLSASLLICCHTARNPLALPTWGSCLMFSHSFSSDILSYQCLKEYAFQ